MESLGMNPNFWKGKKVLITGHTGFKGGWLSLWLQGKGASVIGYSLQPAYHPNLFELAHVEDGIVSVISDIRNLENLHSVIAQHKPEIVFHLAAQPLVRFSYKNPVETYGTNVMGTVNVLEACRLSNCVKALVNITSDKCYENREWHWGYRENDPMGGHDPYSSSKGCAELITSAYRSSFFSDKNSSANQVSVATVRAGNVIGGGDWAEDRLIPDIMRSFMDGQPVLIRNPGSIRPWQHVLEPLHGYLMLAEKLWEDGEKFAGGWNFGPSDDDARPVEWIADRLTKMWGGGASWVLDKAEQVHEATYLKLDCSKARNIIRWSPKMDLATALEWIVEWYGGYKDKKEMRKITEKQIRSYEEL